MCIHRKEHKYLYEYPLVRIPRPPSPHDVAGTTKSPAGAIATSALPSRPTTASAALMECARSHCATCCHASVLSPLFYTTADSSTPVTSTFQGTHAHTMHLSPRRPTWTAGCTWSGVDHATFREMLRNIPLRFAIYPIPAINMYPHNQSPRGAYG